MRKGKKLIALFYLGLLFLTAGAQQPGDIYKKRLVAVLPDIEHKFNIRLRYDPKLVESLEVQYATWRFTQDVNSTLDNILKPLDLVYSQVDRQTYEIRPYDYYRRTEEEGRKHLDQLLSLYSGSASFDKRKTDLKACITKALGLSGSAKRTPLNPVFRSKTMMDGYSVENVAFESLPGYFVTGTLYRPAKASSLYPVILSPHGHFFNEGDPSVKEDSGRYRADMQYRCAALAKMGAIVLSYDMYAWGESALQTGGFSFHETSFAAAIQTWNSMRALDFLLSLKNADKARVGVTGASGGGTQTILVAALDDRVTASVPVVMVSSSFYGGCPCESGLPIHDDCQGYKTNNAEIAAMFAPRPQLLLSDGDDWTRSVPGTDFPYLQKVYGLYGQKDKIESVYLPEDKHDYGITKRIPMYHFFSKVFGLNLQAITGAGGKIDESRIRIQKNEDLHVFSSQFPLPAHALRSHQEIVKAFEAIRN